MTKLDDELRAAQATITLLQLQQLDVLWTAHLGNGSARVTPENLPALRDVGKRMSQFLGEPGTAVATLYEIASENSDVLEQRYTDLFQYEELTSKQREYLQTKGAPAGNFLGRLGEALSVWADETGSEKKLLQEKLDAIEARRNVYGDLSHKFICELCVALVAGSLLIGNYPVAGMAVGIAAGAGC
jgi:hypothetical protein